MRIANLWRAFCFGRKPPASPAPAGLPVPASLHSLPTALSQWARRPLRNFLLLCHALLFLYQPGPLLRLRLRCCHLWHDGLWRVLHSPVPPPSPFPGLPYAPSPKFTCRIWGVGSRRLSLAPAISCHRPPPEAWQKRADPSCGTSARRLEGIAYPDARWSRFRRNQETRGKIA